MFTLHIAIDSAAQVDSMKADLTKYLPSIKSSHRVEALARALGFKTYAALRSATLPIEVAVNWPAFNDYLREKGFSATAKPLYLAAGRAVIRLIMELYPNLTRAGVGINTQHHRGETTQEYVERFRRERADMLSDSSVEEFLRSYSLVLRIPKTRTITTKRGAYGLKHIAENASFFYPDGEESPPNYVCTGSLIFAAVNAGFRYKDYPDSQSVSFNMLQSVIDDLDCEIRPDGATAQSREARKIRKNTRAYA